jgi:hypothetical protein
MSCEHRFIDWSGFGAPRPRQRHNLEDEDDDENEDDSLRALSSVPGAPGVVGDDGVLQPAWTRRI